MTGALLILLVTVGAGALLFVAHVIGERRAKPGEEPEAGPPPAAGECCGMHIACERDSLLQGFADEAVYYDDYELDAYKGVAPGDYTDSQVEEFRDVLLTLLPADIAGWARSLQARGIAMPPTVKDELLLLVAEERGRLSRQTQERNGNI